MWNFIAPSFQKALQYRYDYPTSSSTAITITAFVVALEEAELLCTIVSDPSTGVIIQRVSLWRHRLSPRRHEGSVPMARF
jgi:hypothetical protein